MNSGIAKRLGAPDSPTPTSAVPLAFLFDYDGTIALADISEMLVPDSAGAWEKYSDGLVGSRRLLAYEVSLIRAERDELLMKVEDQPLDPGFVPLVQECQTAGIPVEVVSDGYGFFIEPALERLGVPGLPVITSRLTFAEGGASIDFPNGHPACFVCGTCKRQRVLAHQKAGRAVVFVGDSWSDRYAAGYADFVFAKGNLEALCIENGWPFSRWTDMSQISTWLNERLREWQHDPTNSLLRPPVARPYYCGPEVWGAGRWDPPELTG